MPFDEIKRMEDICRRWRLTGAITKRDTGLLIERIDAFLEENRHDVTAQYLRLASHIIKWHAMPAKRSRSWMLTIEDARRNIDAWITGGNKLAKYARGMVELNGHKLDPQDVYRRAVKMAQNELKRSHPDAPRASLQKLASVFAAAPSLTYWMTTPIIFDDLPDYEKQR